MVILIEEYHKRISVVKACMVENIYLTISLSRKREQSYMIWSLIQFLSLFLFQFWFQNRRAKLRRQEKANCHGNVAETGLQNSLYLQFYSTSGKADQSRSLALPVHARQVHWSQFSPRHTGYSFNAPKQAPCSCCATQSNRFPTAHAPFSSNEEYMTYKPNLFH